MKKITIFDKNINELNFGRFRSCKIQNSGKYIEVFFMNGKSYLIPLNYLLQWFSKPHLVYKEGKWIEWKEKNKFLMPKNIVIKRCRLVRGCKCVRVYLSNNIAYDLIWDTVLMACEEHYEFFGGLTTKSKNLTNRFFKK